MRFETIFPKKCCARALIHRARARERGKYKRAPERLFWRLLRRIRLAGGTRARRRLVCTCSYVIYYYSFFCARIMRLITDDDLWEKERETIKNEQKSTFESLAVLLYAYTLSSSSQSSSSSSRCTRYTYFKLVIFNLQLVQTLAFLRGSGSFRTEFIHDRVREGGAKMDAPGEERDEFRREMHGVRTESG